MNDLLAVQCCCNVEDLCLHVLSGSVSIPGSPMRLVVFCRSTAGHCRSASVCVAHVLVNRDARMVSRFKDVSTVSRRPRYDRTFCCGVSLFDGIRTHWKMTKLRAHSHSRLSCRNCVHGISPRYMYPNANGEASCARYGRLPLFSGVGGYSVRRGEGDDACVYVE